MRTFVLPFLVFASSCSCPGKKPPSTITPTGTTDTVTKPKPKPEPTDTGVVDLGIDPVREPIPEGLSPWQGRLWNAPLIVRAQVTGHAYLEKVPSQPTVESVEILELLKGDDVASVGQTLSVFVVAHNPDVAQVQSQSTEPRLPVGTEAVLLLDELYDADDPGNPSPGTTLWARDPYAESLPTQPLAVFAKAPYKDDDYVASAHQRALLQLGDDGAHSWIIPQVEADFVDGPDGVERPDDTYTKGAVSWSDYLDALRAETLKVAP